MEAGTSRSVPGTHLRDGMKKGGQKQAKKRNNAEEEEAREEVGKGEKERAEAAQEDWPLASC